MTIKAVRVSKTSFKTWYLSGPVDQALLTSTQAKALKVVPLHLDDVHGEPVDCELWINAEAVTDPEHQEPNPGADKIIELDKLRNADTVGALLETENLPAVQGVAILTGVGGTNFPEGKDGQYKVCILGALLGQHKPSDAEIGGGDEPPTASGA